MHTLTHTVRKYFMVISVFNFLNYSFIKWYNPVWGRNIIQPFCIYYDCHTQSPYGPFCCDKRSSSLLNVRPGAWCVQFNNWRWTDKAHCIILRHVTCYLHLYSFIFTSLLSRQTGIWLLIWDATSLSSVCGKFYLLRLNMRKERKSEEAVLLKQNQPTTRMSSYKNRHTLNILPQMRLWDLLRGMSKAKSVEHFI